MRIVIAYLAGLVLGFGIAQIVRRPSRRPADDLPERCRKCGGA